MLFPICQRYNFESKSQPPSDSRPASACCFRYVKDTILKANHNVEIYNSGITQLFPICQRYNFESKSQPFFDAGNVGAGCFRYVKDTILKANHNLPINTRGLPSVVSMLSKIVENLRYKK